VPEGEPGCEIASGPLLAAHFPMNSSDAPNLLTVSRRWPWTPSSTTTATVTACSRWTRTGSWTRAGATTARRISLRRGPCPSSRTARRAFFRL